MGEASFPLTATVGLWSLAADSAGDGRVVRSGLLQPKATVQ